jgi:adenylate cyclase
VGALTRQDVADRAGVDVGYVDQLARAGILWGDDDGSFTVGAGRAARIVRDLELAGLPLDGIAAAVREGFISFEIFDADVYDRVAPLSGQSFRDVAELEGIPLPLLLVVREAIGFAVADPDDKMREDELAVVPLLRSGLRGGFPAGTVERLLRVYGDSHRRMVETESEAWVEHVFQPLVGRGMSLTDALEEGSRWGETHLPLLDQASMAIHRGQQDHVWMTTTYEWVEEALERAGVRSRVVRPPAMCFVDLAGYTRMTEEQGDQAAAETALSLGQVVQRTAHEHRGRVVKWLGDGVML